MDEVKTPREMAEEIAKEFTQSNDVEFRWTCDNSIRYFNFEDLITTLLLRGIEVGAKMGWYGCLEQCPVDLPRWFDSSIEMKKQFERWWANLQETK